MLMELKKIAPTSLRAVGLDERWLQERIREDTALLGLGELEIVGREHRQPSGGKIDFLMYDAEPDCFYEIEVMLGVLDESHIIRTIEYWDIERQRRPNSEHRAVIVAEQITSRFFNVLRLLNRSVPMIAIQLAAFRPDEHSIALHAVKVLDIIEETAGSDVSSQVEGTDRGYWEKRKDPTSLAMVDQIIARLTASGIAPRITYNKHHIALGSTGNNFCWFHFRTSAGAWFVEIKIGADNRETALAALQASDIEASPSGTEEIKFWLTKERLDQNLDLLMTQLLLAEKNSL